MARRQRRLRACREQLNPAPAPAPRAHSVLSAAFCAFNFSPLALPLRQTRAVVHTLSNLFRDQPSLCEGFWVGDRLTGGRGASAAPAAAVGARGLPKTG